MCLLCAQIIFFWGLPPIILVIHGLLWTLTKIEDMWLLSGNCLGTCVTAAFSREKNKKEMFHIVTDVCRFNKNTMYYVCTYYWGRTKARKYGGTSCNYNLSFLVEIGLTESDQMLD